MKLIKQGVALLFFFLVYNLSANSQNKKLFAMNASSIGFIVLNDTTYSGTGFVFLEGNQVLTCFHVIDTTKNISFHSMKNGSKNIPLRIVKFDVDHDLALLVSDEIISPTPLLCAPNFYNVPSQPIIYMGYNPSDTSKKVLQTNFSVTTSTGLESTGKLNAEFMEFLGVGIPGYSGGPVLNLKGEIIGIMREAWYKQGLHAGSPVMLINRAFSVLPIIQ